MQYEGQSENSLRKKVIGKSMLIFFAVMLLLTFFSNTINNFSLPKVTYEMASGGSLVKDISGAGNVEAMKSENMYIQANMKVISVIGKVGDNIKKGQVFLTLDTSDTAIQLKDEQDRYEQKKLNLEKLLEANSLEALLNYDNSIDTANMNFIKAEEDYNNIKNLYESGSETADTLESSRVGFENTKRDYEMAKKSKETAIKNNQRDIKNAQLEIDIEKRKLAQLEEEMKLNEIKAPVDGVITELNFPEGTMTNNSKTLYKIADTSKGFHFTATVDIDSVTYLAIGDDVEVTFNSLNGKTIQGKLDEIVDNQQQRGVKKDLVIKIPPDGLTGGESGNASISKNIGAFKALVSNSAIGQDNNGYFVYILKEKKGPLGNEYYVQKVSVTVKDSDDSKTAVLSGITNFESIIVSTDKTISDGTRVILSE